MSAPEHDKRGKKLHDWFESKHLYTIINFSKSQPLAAFFCLVIIFSSLCLVVLSVTMSAKRLVYFNKSHSWASVKGVVVEGLDISCTKYESKQIIKYKYTVYGVSHIGDKLNNGGACIYSMRQRFDLGNQYQTGTAVRVFYDPKNPSTAVLRREAASPGEVIGVPLALVISVPLLASFFRSIRDVPDPRSRRARRLR